MPAGTSYLFKEGMLSHSIEQVDTGDNKKTYYKFTVKNHFLHAVHPVGWIQKLDIEIDNASINESDVFFILRGQWLIASKMHTIREVFWNLCEEAEVCFALSAPLKAGDHTVKCIFTTSMLEDTRVLDETGAWPTRVEFVDGTINLRGAV